MARIVKTLRIIRIFKLARHSTGLQALGNTMKANYKELGLLFLLLFMGAIMFSSLIFVFEKEDPESTFKTMFDAYWWAIITMTTVSLASIFVFTTADLDKTTLFQRFLRDCVATGCSLIMLQTIL